MIIYVKMDIFESPAQVIVNTVNTVGVMGKGIAKQYKQFYPEMFKEYQFFCENKLLDIGKLWIYKTEGKWILNFPTKKHWRSPSKIEYIEKGLQKFVETYKEKGVRSISFPPLGCGNGGLDWENEVRPLMEKYLKNIDIDVYIHLPMSNYTTENKEHKNISEIKKWLYSDPISLSFYEVWEDINNVLKQDSDICISGRNYSAKVSNSNTYNDEIIQLNNVELGLNDEISKEEISDTWKLIRQNGVLTEKMLPNHLKRNKSSVFSILLLLPYVGTIMAVSIQRGEEITETGIRLKPLNDNRTSQEAFQI